MVILYLAFYGLLAIYIMRSYCEGLIKLLTAYQAGLIGIVVGVVCILLAITTDFIVDSIRSK